MKRFLLIPLLLSTTPLWAQMPTVESSTTPVRPFGGFIRTIELEGGVMSAGRDKHGVQMFRLESRYLDPDVNAFVGLIVTASHFNQRLSLADLPEPIQGSTIWNWGAAVGFVRGRHTWALDLMGSNLGSHLAFGPAIVGEHTYFKRWALYHRTAVDFYGGDTVLDSDQGLIWKFSKSFALTGGYRIFAAKHTSRNGPRISLRWRFENPFIPFLFPSIG